MILEFSCRYPNFKIMVKPTKRDRDSGEIMERRRAIEFDMGRVRLNTKDDADLVEALAKSHYFESSGDSRKCIWPLDIDEYNKYAKENKLPEVKGSGKLVNVPVSDKKAMEAIAKKDQEIKELRAKLDAMQEVGDAAGSKTSRKR